MANSTEIQPTRNNENVKPTECRKPDEINERGKELPIHKPDVTYFENNSRSAFEAMVRSAQQETMESTKQSESNETKHEGLTDEEKAKVKEAHPDWPDEIIDAIGSWEEYEIYDKAGLHCEYINGKPCLVRSDIDMEQKDEFGLTNRERMERGLAPISKSGEIIELHHIGQKADSPLAELTTSEHRGSGNYSVLHDSTKPSEIDRESFNTERQEHWKSRVPNS